jgi:hypothetical protein
MHFVYLPTLRRFGSPIGIRLDFRTMIPRDCANALHARVLQGVEAINHILHGAPEGTDNDDVQKDSSWWRASDK